jgi:hypothetical protein
VPARRQAGDDFLVGSGHQRVLRVNRIGCAIASATW